MIDTFCSKRTSSDQPYLGDGGHADGGGTVSTAIESDDCIKQSSDEDMRRILDKHADSSDEDKRRILANHADKTSGTDS